MGKLRRTLEVGGALTAFVAISLVLARQEGLIKSEPETEEVDLARQMADDFRQRHGPILDKMD